MHRHADWINLHPKQSRDSSLQLSSSPHICHLPPLHQSLFLSPTASYAMDVPKPPRQSFLYGPLTHKSALCEKLNTNRDHVTRPRSVWQKNQWDYHTQTVTMSYFQSKITLKLATLNTWHGPNSNLQTIHPMKYVRLTLACPKSYDFENKKENWHRMVKMWTFLNVFTQKLLVNFIINDKETASNTLNYTWHFEVERLSIIS